MVNVGIIGLERSGRELHGRELSDAPHSDLGEALSAGQPPAITAQRSRDVVAILEATHIVVAPLDCPGEGSTA